MGDPDEFEPFRVRARALRQRAQAAETPLARTTLEETASRFEKLAEELAGRSPRPPRKTAPGTSASGT